MTPEPTGQATKTTTAFRMECAVAIHIQAKPETVWALLTRAADFPRWNSTVKSIEGEIAQGQRLAIRVEVAPKRVFKPRVTEFVAPARMVWSDGAAPMFKGVRDGRGAERRDAPHDQGLAAGLRPALRAVRGRPEARSRARFAVTGREMRCEGFTLLRDEPHGSSNKRAWLHRTNASVRRDEGVGVEGRTRRYDRMKGSASRVERVDTTG
jgi:uncharacterized protein YndB with AHSA1/START domain